VTRNLPASVRQRLLNRARADGEAFERMLLRYANERFLYRLSVSSWSDDFVLKGGAMLLYRLGATHRMTVDVDFHGRTERSLDEMVRCSPMSPLSLARTAWSSMPARYRPRSSERTYPTRAFVSSCSPHSQRHG